MAKPKRIPSISRRRTTRVAGARRAASTSTGSPSTAATPATGRKPPVAKAAARARGGRPVTAKNPAVPRGPVPTSEMTQVLDFTKRLAELAEKQGLSELSVDTSFATITLRRGQVVESITYAPSATTAPAPSSGSAPSGSIANSGAAQTNPDDANAAATSSAHVITSPFVGTFYRRPNPEASVYVELGARVEKGQPLCIIEAMKLMNEIESDIDGTVVEVLVADGVTVEYGQALFRVKP